MVTISPRYIGTMAEIKSIENEHLAVCTVINVEGSAIEFAAGDRDYIPLIEYRQPVKMILRLSGTTDLILIGVAYLSTNTFLRVEDVQTVSDFERRGAFRVNLYDDGKLFPFLSDKEQQEFDEKMEQASPEEAKKLLEASYIPVQIIDLSLTGVRLRSNEKLRVNTDYFLEFMLLDHLKNYALRVERLIHTPAGEEQYGCSFFDMSRRMEDALVRDLFQLQRLERNRRQQNISHTEEL